MEHVWAARRQQAQGLRDKKQSCREMGLARGFYSLQLKDLEASYLKDREYMEMFQMTREYMEMFQMTGTAIRRTREHPSVNPSASLIMSMSCTRKMGRSTTVWCAS